MSFFEIVGAVTAVISFFSLIGNILQYTKKREESKDLRRFTQEHYNNYYHIARALTRLRKTIDSDEDVDKKLKNCEAECNYVRGIADSARISLINFSNEELNYTLKFQHPAYPDKSDFSEEIKMGTPPDVFIKKE